jgi:hypothetical protein
VDRAAALGERAVAAGVSVKPGRALRKRARFSQGPFRSGTTKAEKTGPVPVAPPARALSNAKPETVSYPVSVTLLAIFIRSFGGEPGTFIY